MPVREIYGLSAEREAEGEKERGADHDSGRERCGKTRKKTEERERQRLKVLCASFSFNTGHEVTYKYHINIMPVHCWVTEGIFLLESP